jgi:TRAP-type C4-dicarboxylate transport system substrate-binding protein
VLDGPVGQEAVDKLQVQDQLGLVCWGNGFRNRSNNKRAVNRLDGREGLKLRVVQTNAFIDTFDTLGGAAVPLRFAEFFTALETQVAEGQEKLFNTTLSSRLCEVQKCLTVTNRVDTP